MAKTGKKSFHSRSLSSSAHSTALHTSPSLSRASIPILRLPTPPRKSSPLIPDNKRPIDPAKTPAAEQPPNIPVLCRSRPYYHHRDRTPSHLKRLGTNGDFIGDKWRIANNDRQILNGQESGKGEQANDKPSSERRTANKSVFSALSILARSWMFPGNFITSSCTTGLIICFRLGIHYIGAERPLEGPSFRVSGVPNMGLELLFSAASGKRGNNARLLGGNVGYVGRIWEEDLGIIATAAIGALVVHKGWLWYRDICKARARSSEEKGVWLRFLSCCLQITLYTSSAYWIRGVMTNISLFKATLLLTINALENSLASIGSLAVGLTMARSHLHSSPSYTYAYISLDNIFHEAASGNYNDTLEESGVVPLLTSSNSIDSCLHGALKFYNRNGIWVGFQVSVLCMIPLRSGTTTIFAILASSPVALKRYVPAQYYKTLEASPGIGVEDVWTP
ncbi:hypothetical protein HOY80DRAFT_1134574 [Tuber brumale]|nr:hypothetical protein HOY80DRAFT_1134574 [Tuber brumale]